jgi:hypothetical protein
MRLRNIVLAGSTGLALVAGGTAAGAAIASGPVNGSGVIHGCYTTKAIKGSHSFVLQDIGTSCPTGTTAITWNQHGPAGPQGPAGATGAQGPAGPSTAGPSGLDVEIIEGPLGESGTSTATCPADHPYVLGGGSTQGSGSIAASLPVGGPGEESNSGNGWAVTTTGFPDGPPVSAYAICAK